MALALAYLGLILVGGILLKLPWCAEAALTWDEAIFTATSAVTVTGLVLIETGPAFTFWGELVILLLMQLGGLGLMTFGVLALLTLGWRVTGRLELHCRGGCGALVPADLLQAGRAVVRLALLIQLGAILPLALVWVPEHGIWQGLWWAVFHAVSAFNNAGFTLSPDSLMAYVGDPVVNLTISALYLVGGLGFVVLVGLWHARQTLRLDINVKVVLVGTVLLSAVGTALIYLAEAGDPGTLGGLPHLGDRLWAAWLQATTPRTAGFNSIDIGAMTQPGCLILMLLMFIGAGPNGTGSGIKVTTFCVLVAATWNYIRGGQYPRLFGHPISQVVILQSLAVGVMAVSGIFMGTLMLSMTENAGLLAVSFEAVSAMSTVGLSRGLTPGLSTLGELAVMVMMFVGRLCPLTVAYYVGAGLLSGQREGASELHIG